jgi:hypothetical protein
VFSYNFSDFKGKTENENLGGMESLDFRTFAWQIPQIKRPAKTGLLIILFTMLTVTNTLYYAKYIYIESKAFWFL